MSDYEAMISEVADLARRIGPARTPEDIRDRLEGIVARHRRRAVQPARPARPADAVGPASPAWPGGTTVATVTDIIDRT